MEEPLNIESELKRYGLHLLKPLDSAYWFEHRLPAVTHTHAIGALQDGLYVGTMAGDSFELGLASALIQFVREHQAEMDLAVPGKILTGFRHRGFGFDCVLLLSPKGA